MEYIIRKATQEDLDSVLSLGRKIVDQYERTHLGDEMADSYINSGACDSDFIKIYDTITVILSKQEIIGLISCNENTIQGLLIDLPYLGTGAAQTLLDYAIKNLFNDYSKIELECFETSPRANAFYQKMDFQNKGFADGDGGMRIIYEKRI